MFGRRVLLISPDSPSVDTKTTTDRALASATETLQLSVWQWNSLMLASPMDKRAKGQTVVVTSGSGTGEL